MILLFHWRWCGCGQLKRSFLFGGGGRRRGGGATFSEGGQSGQPCKGSSIAAEAFFLHSRGDLTRLEDVGFHGNPPQAPPPKAGKAAEPAQVAFVPMAPPSSPVCWRLASVLLPLCPPGLIQSLKDHVTKPTTMAQGRVAHLIEWKGWSAAPVGCGQPPGEEVLYEELTDELKEARFAAGVAEQFAITEATLSGWSSLNEEERKDRRGSQDVIQLQDLEGLHLQDGLLFGPPPPAGSLQAFPLSNQESPIPSGPLQGKEWRSSGRAEGKLVGPPDAHRWQQSATSLRYMDSSSPSEDEVFYD
uniref:Family with sequence similarity 131 member C n=1 Tax=Pseudonaja textilis TaxID=8673 RepID=A0A670ZVE5_PSETE